MTASGPSFFYLIMRRNYEECAATAATFKTRIDFKLRAGNEYNFLVRNKLLDQACLHMKPVYRTLSDDDISEIARGYANRRAFKLGDQSAYQRARERGILDGVCSHMVLKHRDLSDLEIAEIAAKFETRNDFIAGDKPAFQTAQKRGILNEVCAHMDYRVTRRLTDAEILEIAGQYRTRNDFKLGDFGAYAAAWRRGLLDATSAHMEYGYCGYREDLPAVLYQFKLETKDGTVAYKVGITNREPGVRLVTMGLVSGVKATLIRAVNFALGRDARVAEKCLHRLNAALRYAGEPLMQNGNTEVFVCPLIS